MYKKLLSTEKNNLITGIKISSLLIQFTYLVFPLSMYIVYNKVIASKNPNTLLIIVLFLLAIIIIQLILKITESIQHNILKTDEEITNQKQYISAKINSNNTEEISKLQNKNDFVELLSVGNCAEKNIQNHISKSYLVFLAIYLCLILLIGKYIIIIPLFFFSLNYIVARALSKKADEHNERYKKFHTKKRTFIRETLQKIKVIKGLNISSNISKKYSFLSYICNAEKCSSLYFQNVSLKFSMVINIVNISFILLFGRYLFSIGILNIEQIITCSLMTVWISRPMAQFFQNSHNFESNYHEIENINNSSNFKATPNDINHPEYKKILQHLNEFSITYYKPNKAYSLKKFAQTYISSNTNNKTDNIVISYINEQFNLFYGSIIDNITIFDNSKQNQAKSLIQELNLNQLINNLPYNYNYVTTGCFDESLPFDLKIGIEVIRELICKPSIFVLDIDENRMNKSMVNGIKKYSAEQGIKIILLKSDNNINNKISEIKNKILKQI